MRTFPALRSSPSSSLFLEQRESRVLSLAEGLLCARYCTQWPLWLSALSRVAAMSIWAARGAGLRGGLREHTGSWGLSLGSSAVL